MKKKKILVTGGAGFIGSNFCNINRQKYDVVALDNLFLGDTRNLHSDILFLRGDSCLREDLERCGTDFDAVLHLAGTSSAPMFGGDGFVDGYTNSVQSFVVALDFARSISAKKFLYASTSSLYGNNPMPLTEDQQVNPPNHYACTKFLYENCAQCYNQMYPEIDIIGFRFMSIYGPNEEAKGIYANIISQFVWDVARGLPPVIYGNGDQFRDFTNVADVVQGITLALEHKEKLGAEVFNIGTGSTCSFNQIMEQVNAAFETDIKPIHIENPVKETYVKGQHADISKIQSVLGFAPQVALDEGVKAQVRDLRAERIRGTSSDGLR